MAALLHEYLNDVKRAQSSRAARGNYVESDWVLSTEHLPTLKSDYVFQISVRDTVDKCV